MPEHLREEAKKCRQQRRRVVRIKPHHRHHTHQAKNELQEEKPRPPVKRHSRKSDERYEQRSSQEESVELRHFIPGDPQEIRPCVIIKIARPVIIEDIELMIRKLQWGTEFLPHKIGGALMELIIQSMRELQGTAGYLPVVIKNKGEAHH